MNRQIKLFSLCSVLFFVLCAPVFSAGTASQSSASLNILLTNDDGYDSPALQALRGALLAAGHNVTVVAPLENQSGMGAAAIDADWVEVIEQEPGVWSVDNSPTVAARVGIDLVMANNPPDLLISGMNFGQNLGHLASIASGTVCAALVGSYENVPSIAVNVGFNIEEYNSTPIPFISTFQALPPAADFTVRLLGQLQQTAKGGPLLPARTMLNVNFPVPYGDIQGVKFTRLGYKTFIEPNYLDVFGVIPSGGGVVMVSFSLPQPPDPAPDADTTAFWDGFISITVMDGDMSSLYPPAIGNKLKQRLSDVQPY